MNPKKKFKYQQCHFFYLLNIFHLKLLLGLMVSREPCILTHNIISDYLFLNDIEKQLLNGSLGERSLKCYSYGSMHPLLMATPNVTGARCLESVKQLPSADAFTTVIHRSRFSFKIILCLLVLRLISYRFKEAT